MWSLIRQSVQCKLGIIIQNNGLVITYDIPQLSGSFIYFFPPPIRVWHTKYSAWKFDERFGTVGPLRRVMLQRLWNLLKMNGDIYYLYFVFCRYQASEQIHLLKINFTKLKKLKITLKDKNIGYDDVWMKRKPVSESLYFTHILLAKRRIFDRSTWWSITVLVNLFVQSTSKMDLYRELNSKYTRPQNKIINHSGIFDKLSSIVLRQVLW